MAYEPDHAFRDCRSLWLALGRALKKKALDRAEAGHETLAVKTARLAEVCFWQATGEGDQVSMKDVFPKAEA